MHPWQRVKIIKSIQACADIKSITVEAKDFLRHKAGQYYEICMPGESIIRDYSVVSSIYDREFIEFGVQLIENGALSPTLWRLKEGDEIEIRGPLGESFIWDPEHSGPLILIGAGSGITPLLSIYHSYRATHPDGKYIFMMSAKDPSRIMHYEKLKDILVTKFTKTEERIDLEFLKKNIGKLALDKNAKCYISGPDNFIDDMVDYVLEIGIVEDNIRSERFI